jgi:hypothetical protein
VRQHVKDKICGINLQKKSSLKLERVTRRESGDPGQSPNGSGGPSAW